MTRLLLCLYLALTACATAAAPQHGTLGKCSDDPACNARHPR